MSIEFTFPRHESAATYTVSVNGAQAATFSVTNFLCDSLQIPDTSGKKLLWMPCALSGNIRVPMIVIAHGSGRAAEDYLDVPFYVEQRDLAMRYGYAVAVISNGTDTWGTDKGVENFSRFVEYLVETYPGCTRLGIWATSAGGVTALRTIAAGKQRYDFMIGTFPVYDLLIEHQTLASCRTAWGNLSYDTFAEQIKGKNPPDLVDALIDSGCRFYITHGDADTAVPYPQNAERMAADLGDAVTLETISGGTHGTANFAFYGAAVEAAFAENPAEYTYFGDHAAGDRITLCITDKNGVDAVEEYIVDEQGNLLPYMPEAEPDTTAPASDAPTSGKEKPGRLIPIHFGVAVALAGVLAAIWQYLRKKHRH